MPNPRIVVAFSSLFLIAASAFPLHMPSVFSLDLSPLHRISTTPTLQAGTYATADPRGSHRHTQSLVHHHSL